MLEEATLASAEEFANGPTLAHAATKQLAYIAANEGVLAADDAMEELQKPIWTSDDLKTGLASFRKNGPGLARFEGRLPWRAPPPASSTSASYALPHSGIEAGRGRVGHN